MPLLETILLVSGGLNAAGQVVGGLGARRRANDVIREGNRLAQDALDRGERDAELYGMDLAQLLGTQRTNVAASGLDVNQGSALALREQTERFGAEDITTIRENALREALGLRRAARQGARELRSAATSQFLGAAGTVLNLGANAYDIYSRRRALNTRVANTVGRDIAAWG